MNHVIMNPAITVGVFAALAIILLFAAFVRLAKVKGIKAAFQWLLFVPMPFTKAMYMLILATIAARSEQPIPCTWMWGAALAFCLVICVQWAIADWRINNERLSANSADADTEAPWWFKYVRGNLPFKLFVPFVMCAIVETIAVMALVATMIFGQNGMNMTVRATGRKAGSLAASFAVGVAEGVRDAISTNETAAAVAPSNENQTELSK